MKRKEITLKNDFHSTEVTLLVAKNRSGNGYVLSEYQIGRARRKLCGVTGCHCGNDLGMRGPQSIGREYEDWTIDIDTRPYFGGTLYLRGK